MRVTCYRPAVARALAAAIVLAALTPAAPARAYRLELSARTLAKLYELPALRLIGGDLTLSRRQFRQDLAITAWDLGDLAARRARRHPGLPDRGPVAWVTADLQLDHDFGAWTMGQVALGDDRLDAIDAIPELASGAVGFTIPYAYLAIDRLGGALDVRLGRQLRFDEFGGAGLDGVALRIHTGVPLAIELEGGLRVRDRSPLAIAGSDLDGLAGADCREYVEGATPGTGTWQVIDRSRAPRDTRLASDRGFCPQRDAWQPTVELAVAADGVPWLDARLAYRRTRSRTVGLIGAVDRLDHPDTGLYPDEQGQAPAWGDDAELVSAAARARRKVARLALEPWAYARYSLLHAGLERAGAGVLVARGAHAIEPEVARTVPVFDGDSIWSVFAIRPAIDARLRYGFRRGARRLGALAWLRRYDRDPDGTGLVLGGVASAAAELSRLALRGELYLDGGYGGRRFGGNAYARWPATRAVELTAGLAVVNVAGASPRSDGTSATALGHAAWQLDEGIAVMITGELGHAAIAPLAFRTLAVLDLAFEPDM